RGAGQPIVYRLSHTGHPAAHEPRARGAWPQSELGGRRAGEIRGEADHAMSSVQTAYSTIEEALEDIVAGRMIVVVDDEDRENEGDLVMAAQFITPDAINFMTRQAGGWICLSMTPERGD